MASEGTQEGDPGPPEQPPQETPRRPGPVGDPPAQKTKTQRKRRGDLPPCSNDKCSKGCRRCCGKRPRPILNIVRQHVDRWDEAMLQHDVNDAPLEGEHVTVKLGRDHVIDKSRAEGNIFSGKVVRRCDSDTFEVYVKQGRYPKIDRGIYTLPLTAIRRTEQRISSATIKELARRIGEGGYPGVTAYRIRTYRERGRERPPIAT
jgi:hypothetical protein